MKKILIATFILCLFFGKESYSAPEFYFTNRDASGGLFKIDGSSKTASKIDTITAYHDFDSLSRYGTNQLIVSDVYGAYYSYESPAKILVFNTDGTIDSTKTISTRSEWAIESNQGNGDIYFAPYFTGGVRKISASDGTESLYAQGPYGTGSCFVVQRSDNSFYVATYSNIFSVPTISTIYSIEGTGGIFWSVSVDSNDNIFCLISPDQANNKITKVDSSNNSSIFWEDPDIRMYGFSFNPVDEFYYGIGKEVATGDFNVYRFNSNGSASVYLSDISNMPSYLYLMDFVVLEGNGSSGENTVPEPATIMLLFAGLVSRSVIRFVKSRC